MIGETYPFLSEDYLETADTLFFTFLSQGDRVIPKAIAFSPIEKAGNKFYNWGFGDLVVNQTTSEFAINDRIETNNGDVKTVLYTVVLSLSNFFEVHPDATVYVEGSNRQRSEVYRGIINRYWRQVEPLYKILGCINGKMESFKSTTEYEYLLISKKTLNLVIMRTMIKENKKGLTADTLGQLQTYIGNVRKGAIEPFKEKTERARKNLKKAKLIK